jgi:DNA-binding response OmpR family regulator
MVVEDDVKQAELLREYLRQEGHRVDVAHDGLRALEEIRTLRPDVVLLDLQLPTLSGSDIAAVIRYEQIPTTIIMVTARSTEHDRIEGLDLGADDYVTKPYSMRELMARVRAAVRRSGDDTRPNSTALGALVIDHDGCEVRVHGKAIELTPRELDILETLAERPGRVFSRTEILAEAAGFDHDALERTVDMHIVNLRKKIEPDPATPQFVLTVKGRGYKLAVPEPPAEDETA